AYEIPTEQPESDGTLAWEATTLVLVEVAAGERQGLGFTYAHQAAATLIHSQLAPLVQGQDALAVPNSWARMIHAIRNLGRPGICATAISAVDTALWDLKARLLEVPLVSLLGSMWDKVPVYGSGGFTSYTRPKLQEQLGGWVEQGITRVKMKIGRHAAEDLARVQAAREAIGPEAELFVDANGGYSRKQALGMAERMREYGLTWFEERVSSDDLTGLRLLRDRAPGAMEITAGEYGYDPPYFRRMLAAGAVDVLQADLTRCLGISGFLQVGALCDAWLMPLSAHTAPALHLHPACSLRRMRHLEYFFDHVRIEQMLFDGALTPVDGFLAPDLTRLGLGLEFKHADAAAYAL
ncbi:MAG TPA: enolase C-terminal domain-like protein, partial [Anaerolineae bacterium]|nr:enolase C-terminal domain-like protein [Anaerolineae bacterium]